MDLSNWCSVITAGGKSPPELQTVCREVWKALSPIGEMTSVERVVKAVIHAGIHKIAVIGPDEVKQKLETKYHSIKYAPPGKNPLQSAKNGAELYPNANLFLFLPADSPLITQKDVSDFVELISSKQISEKHIFAGLSEKKDIENKLPGAKFRYIKFKQGKFATSALTATTRNAFYNALDKFEYASENRKNIIKIIAKLGIFNLLKYISGKACMHEAEKVLSKTLQSEIVFVKDCHPFTCMDFDTAEDYLYIQNRINELIRE